MFGNLGLLFLLLYNIAQTLAKLILNIGVFTVGLQYGLEVASCLFKLVLLLVGKCAPVQGLFVRRVELINDISAVSKNT